MEKVPEAGLFSTAGKQPVNPGLPAAAFSIYLWRLSV